MDLKQSVILASLLVSLFSTSSAIAEELDAASQEALIKTQELLKNPVHRKEVVTQDSNAARANSYVESISSTSEDTQAIYELAADIFGDLAKEAKGDPIKMAELMNRAGQDPNSFNKHLSPVQLEKLKELSNRIPASPKTTPR